MAFKDDLVVFALTSATLLFILMNDEIAIQFVRGFLRMIHFPILMSVTFLPCAKFYKAVTGTEFDFAQIWVVFATWFFLILLFMKTYNPDEMDITNEPLSIDRDVNVLTFIAVPLGLLNGWYFVSETAYI